MTPPVGDGPLIDVVIPVFNREALVQLAAGTVVEGMFLSGMLVRA